MRVVLQRSAWGVQYYLRSRGDQIGAASCRMFYWRTSGALIKPLSDGKLTWQRPSGAAKNYRPAADFQQSMERISQFVFRNDQFLQRRKIIAMRQTLTRQ